MKVKELIELLKAYSESYICVESEDNLRILLNKEMFSFEKDTNTVLIEL